MNYHFKIKTGYGVNDCIYISGLKDLEKAQFAFLTNAKTIFDNGEVCRGQDIISIREDWHKEMGWNEIYRDEAGTVRSYELGHDDWEDIRSKGIDKKYLGVFSEIKAKVKYLMETNQTNLIGKGVEFNKPKEISDISKQLSDKLSVKK